MNKPKDWLAKPGGIAERLSALHDSTGLSGKDLADQLGWAPSKVSRIRNGVTAPTPEDLAAWVQATGGEANLAELADLLNEAMRGRRQDFAHQMNQGQTAVQQSHNDLAAASRTIRNFQMVWVPAFLQTRAYARAVIEENWWLHEKGSDIDEAVATRLKRRDHLNDQTRSFEFLIEEAVLLRTAFPADVMVPQLHYLLDWLDAPNVRLGILPMRGANRLTPRASFQMFDDFVIEEGWAEEYEPKPDVYLRVFSRLFEAAAVGGDAQALIRQAIRGHDAEPGTRPQGAPGVVRDTVQATPEIAKREEVRGTTPAADVPGATPSPVPPPGTFRPDQGRRSGGESTGTTHIGL